MRLDAGQVDYRSASSAPRIVIASSILLYREGLVASIVRDGRLEVVAETDLEGAPAAAAQHRPDVLVLDASTADGLAVARHMKSTTPDLALVGFGISGSASAVISCAEAGLSGFIDQESSIGALVKAVSEATRGEFSCSPKFTGILCSRLARLADQGDKASDWLTVREHEIAGMIAEGMSNKEIALGLRIGPATVKNHVHNILDKLKVRRRAAIASRVLDAAR